MGDPLDSRPAKRRRRGVNVSQARAPGFVPESAIDPTLGAQTAAREEEILSLYEAVTWPTDLNFRQILQPAPLPAPFSPGLSEWITETAGGPLSGIRELYDLVIANSTQIRNEIALKYPFFGPDARQLGLLCWAEYPLPSRWENEVDGSKHLSGNWVEKLGQTTLRLYVETLSFPL